MGSRSTGSPTVTASGRAAGPARPAGWRAPRKAPPPRTWLGARSFGRGAYDQRPMEEHVYRQLYELEDTHWWFRGRRAVIHALLGRAPLRDGPQILDAGCGTGRNISDYARLGETTGVDPSPDAVAFCHARGLQQGSRSGIEELPFEDGAFDLVAATDVLEHIPD